MLFAQPNARIDSFLSDFFIGDLAHDGVIDYLMIPGSLGIYLSMVSFRL